jgi:hypothetical protein
MLIVAGNSESRDAEASGTRTMGFAWHHRFARVEGVRLHWAEQGESTDKPPLVLLHGLNDCYRTWRQLAPRLARDCPESTSMPSA